jgi:DNA-binding transcriptional ArsR family regulator
VDLSALEDRQGVMSNLDATLAALADPTRRAVIDLLRTTPRRAGELANLLEVSPPALSRHLRLLRAQGLVQEEGNDDDARVRMYSLKPEPFSRAAQLARRGRDVLGRPARGVQASRRAHSPQVQQAAERAFSARLSRREEQLFQDSLRTETG